MKAEDVEAYLCHKCQKAYTSPTLARECCPCRTETLSICNNCYELYAWQYMADVCCDVGAIEAKIEELRTDLTRVWTMTPRPEGLISSPPAALDEIHRVLHLQICLLQDMLVKACKKTGLLQAPSCV